jgi:hypothetical protein
MLDIRRERVTVRRHDAAAFTFPYQIRKHSIYTVENSDDAREDRLLT